MLFRSQVLFQPHFSRGYEAKLFLKKLQKEVAHRKKIVTLSGPFPAGEGSVRKFGNPPKTRFPRAGELWRGASQPQSRHLDCMPVKSFNPVTPSRRYMKVSSFSEITKTKPEKRLVKTKKKTGGRNSYGRITARGIGGGHKQKKIGRAAVRERGEISVGAGSLKKKKKTRDAK